MPSEKLLCTYWLMHELNSSCIVPPGPKIQQFGDSLDQLPCNYCRLATETSHARKAHSSPFNILPGGCVGFGDIFQHVLFSRYPTLRVVYKGIYLMQWSCITKIDQLCAHMLLSLIYLIVVLEQLSQSCFHLSTVYFISFFFFSAYYFFALAHLHFQD